MNLRAKIAKMCVGCGVSLILCSSVYGANQDMKFTEPTESIAFEKDKNYYATIYTEKGKIKCQLFPEKAPLSVTNFMQLAEGNFYDGLTFHRVVPNFVIQGGDPQGTGSGGPGYTLPAEIGLPHESGALAWARLPDTVNPNRRSSGSQFYITLDKVSFLDGEYTVFGQTIDGFDVIKQIKPTDKIEKIKISIK
jgi:peptidyl-prolyl cis-trans isomerase B (cyclophilin B)